MEKDYRPNWVVRCLSVPGPDTSLSLYIAFDNARWLFGCGEGTQRAFIQKGLVMRSLTGIIMPSGGSKDRNGLPGLIMTAADAGIRNLDIIGPPDVGHHLASFRASLQRISINVKTHHPSTASSELRQIYDHPSINIKAFSILPSSQSDSNDQSSPIPTPPPFIPITSTVTNPVPHLHPPTQPWALPPDQKNTWIEHIMDDMFSRHFAKPSPDTPGPIRPNSADARYPLGLLDDSVQRCDMIYVFQAPDFPGKFDVASAERLGVYGKARGLLVKGQTVEVKDPSQPGGMRIVRPEECLSGGGTGAVMVIVQCTEKTVSSLLGSSQLNDYKHPGGGKTVALMVHHTSKDIWMREDYQRWVQSFGTEPKVTDTTPSPNEIFFTSAAWNHLHLSQIDSTIFHFPNSLPQTTPPISLPSNTVLLQSGHSIRMHPPGSLELLPRPSKDIPFPLPYLSSISDIPSPSSEYLNACLKAQETVKHLSLPIPPKTSATETTPLQSVNPILPLQDVGMKDQHDKVTYEAEPKVGDDIIITTLGTGSALPSKYRNVSSTLVEIPGTGGVLLDCGEGTLGQLRRRFGDLSELWKDLKMIFISHLHADHHLGLQSILEDRFKHNIHTPLYIIAPIQIALSLQESYKWQLDVPREALRNLVFLPSNRIQGMISRDSLSLVKRVDGGSGSSVGVGKDGSEGLGRGWPFGLLYSPELASEQTLQTNLRALFDALSLEEIQIPLVEHRGRAWGLVLKHQTGWKVVYSGDTMPSENLIQAGKGATVLIHEATLEDDKPDVAKEKGHSTFSQAVGVGRKMGASHILLNHFSQRYPKLPRLAPSSTFYPSYPTIDQTDQTIPSTSEAVASKGTDPSHTISSPLQPDPEPIISISFDLMSIRVGDMWKMSHYMEAMSLLFASEPEESEGMVEGDVNSVGTRQKKRGSGEALLDEVVSAKEDAVGTESGGGAGKGSTTVRKEGQKTDMHDGKKKRRAEKAKRAGKGLSGGDGMISGSGVGTMEGNVLGEKPEVGGQEVV
ncbi:hypothetical protein TREMEDRAFT_70321 [Tremella mesenterica DSM 1558]|uniref:uncharacterized protein n=1 Tax=Tremella mesenterica (strain ATCC 24925 / CBS 8224 / DSM 1558 / NBRC 9311 / NRRL Y-6157 / RJB 2259-6 / UBC 559-6) TaxID=578456 RepID=UPI00032BC818|nr:uncharacterized protein TREMEDRAFT_70321 [Tremella mesenterica DSM 1558]EIW66065.1 hypothetical protein TREMEDRAFT_70321 [Tremella mesenterica DSM 1558]